MDTESTGYGQYRWFRMRFPSALLSQLEVLAKKHYRSLAQEVREAIILYLKAHGESTHGPEQP